MTTRDTTSPASGPTGSGQRPLVRLISPLRDFLHTESAGAVLLAAAALAALVWANSPWSDSYERLWTTDLSLSWGSHSLSLDLRAWVGDALMTVFFLVVGLEIKRELTVGHLASRRAALLPFAAALGGMLVPALIYLAIAGSSAPRGWAVPVATDIALAAGVLAVAGSRLPSSLRAFLLGLAIVDDIGAIIIIAAVYTSDLHVEWLVAAFVGLGVTAVVKHLGIQATWVYLVLGAFVWFALHDAGVHPTLAGVAMGLLAPSTPRLQQELIDVEELTDLSSVDAARTTSHLARGSVSVVEWLQHGLHPWTSYLIVPLFALANAGIPLSGDVVRDAWGSALAWGIVAGLVLGKPLGVVAATTLAVRSGAGDRPADSNGRQLVGIGAAAGIGFTVALFITDLAFTDPAQQAEAKLAVLVGSVVAAAVSIGLLLGRKHTARPA
jgi:NhaA family Na+:H+ antiporter